MFGWSAQSWFYNCAKPPKKEIRGRNQRLFDILSNQRERIAAELDVQKVLSYLVYEGVFSSEEYRDILSRECCEEQAACFLEKLAWKGPAAFAAFCSLLQELCPRLFVSMLDYQGALTRNFTDIAYENSKLRVLSDMDIRQPHGNPLTEDQINHSFDNYRLKLHPEMLFTCPLRVQLTEGLLYPFVLQHTYGYGHT